MYHIQRVLTIETVDRLWRYFSWQTDEELTFRQKIHFFLNNYWRGITFILTPILLLPIVFGDGVLGWHWCAYTLLLMAIFWMTECIPMPVTSFLPILIFPMVGIMSTEKTCQAYVNDTVMMFLATVMGSAAIEQSGLHLRIVYKSAKIIGLSRKKQLVTISFFTMFLSMWTANTGITSMMVPITFAFLKIFELQQVGSIFVVSSEGKYASKMTVCFFCAITYSSSIGGAVTLIGVANDLVHQGVNNAVAAESKSLTLLRYSLFSIPYMLVVQSIMCVTLMVTHMGLFRPNSDDAKLTKVPEYLQNATKAKISQDLQKLGRISYHEIMVIIFYIIVVVILIITRVSDESHGWGIYYEKASGSIKDGFIKDSSGAMLVNFVVLFLPSTCMLCKYFTTEQLEQLPNGPIISILDWHTLNKAIPYNLMFLLGAGFSISEAAKPENTNFIGVVSECMMSIKTLPISVTLFVIIVSTSLAANLASNVVVCNVLTPIASKLARAQRVNPIWYGMAAGYSASYSFLLPVGTPANLIVQFAAKIRNKDMVYCGLGMTVFSIIITWIFMYLLAPLIFKDLEQLPHWIMDDE